MGKGRPKFIYGFNYDGVIYTGSANELCELMHCKLFTIRDAIRKYEVDNRAVTRHKSKRLKYLGKKPAYVYRITTPQNETFTYDNIADMEDDIGYAYSSVLQKYKSGMGMHGFKVSIERVGWNG